MSSPSATPILDSRTSSQSTTSRTSTESAPPYPRPMTPSSVHSSLAETGDNDIIPPYHPAAPRTLVLCFDGTGDQFDCDNSNVVKFFRLLKRDDRREQMVYYQTGIGTYTSTQFVTSLGQSISKTLDAAVAWNLDAHVMDGYEFLMQNYKAGDKICLFGFSRGAYTARALAGMLHKVGLLPPSNHQQIPFAYKMYSREDELGWKQSTAFKKTFSIDVDIDFIGVWDTVSSVGFIPHRLPFTASNMAIRVFRHALSLDERRAKFKANHYNRPSDWESKQGTHGDMPRPMARHPSTSAPRKLRKNPTKGSHTHARSPSTSPSRFANLTRELTRAHAKEFSAATDSTAVGTPAGTVKNSVFAAVEEQVVKVEEVSENVAEVVVEKTSEAVAIVSEDGSKLWKQARGRFDTFRTLMRKKKGKRLTEEEQEFNKSQPNLVNTETDVKEVWFAGCHSDVGGGSVPDSEKHSLARIPLRWMIREVFRTNTGIRFHAELLKEIGLDPASLWPLAKPSYEFGHPPQIPPLMPPPCQISLDPPTPPERSPVEVEKKLMEAQTVFSAQAQTCDQEDAAASPAAHARHVSVSTTGTSTLVGSTRTTAPNVLHTEPVAELTVDEKAEEHQDALCPIYDQLSLAPWWWALEVLPIEQRKQDEHNRWQKCTSFNLGRGRTVLVTPGTQHFYVHYTVKLRLEAESLPGGPYRPKAKWGSLQPVYVD